MEDSDTRSPYYILPDSDPGWRELCSPLLEYLKHGDRTNRQLNEWRRLNKITAHQLVQMLAWSENHHFIYHESGKWHLV